MPRCWKTLQRKRPSPGTEYAMSISKLSLNFCFWRALMMLKAIAMVSSCIRRFCSVSGRSRPSTRITGMAPDLEMEVGRPAIGADLQQIVDVQFHGLPISRSS